MKFKFAFSMLGMFSLGATQAFTGEVVRESANQKYWVEQLAHGLNFPSAMAWLPNGDILVTERQGGLRVFRNGALDPKPLSGVPATFKIGLNGIKDVLLDPDFADNNAIYLAISEGTLEGNHASIYRARYTPGGLKNVQRIFRSKDEIYGAGAACTRMMFLPDKTLLFGVPENNNYKARAQQLSSHIGKVLRINRDGSVPADNPFLKTPGAAPEVWTYGHRETLGFFRDPENGDVWVVESGPKGGDELNLLKPGANYGWAKVSWGFDYTGIMAAPLQTAPGVEDAAYLWTPSVTPAGLMRYRGNRYPGWNGDFFTGHLTGRQLERLHIVDHHVTLTERMLMDLDERIREVKVGPDGYIYLLTDNADGRILRLQPGAPNAAQLTRVAEKRVATPEPEISANAPLPPEETLPGDPVKGKQDFLEHCSGCHSVGNVVRGGNSAPDLQGVYGRAAGNLPGFSYSAAMAGSTQVWTELTLNWFMASPNQYFPGTAMSAPPVRDPDVRRRIVGFLLVNSPPTGDSRPPKVDTAASPDTAAKPDTHAQTSLWDQGNLVAWLAAPPWDAKGRTPEERALMLNKLGFKKFAYNWRPPAIPTFDAEIEALQRHKIELVGWALYGSENPTTQKILDALKRHDAHPSLWLMQDTRNQKEGVSDAEQLARDFPQSAKENAQRVIEEADHIKALVKRAAPYGVKVNIYNHNGWLGMIDNQLAVLERLKTLGITDVGLVYNFSHARDAFHDDSRGFASLWQRMQAHVVAVNITGMHWDNEHVFPSQGDSELEMMRVIQESGWQGPIGIIAEKGGDAEVTLANYLKGLNWLAAELRQPGSGGPRPFPVVP
jgi:glucose/arabinose dehydrogenase/cytochrome c2/sugar phosphate isomerase/epimerase